MRLSRSFMEGPSQKGDRTVPHFSPCVLRCLQILDVDSGAEPQDFMPDNRMEYESGEHKMVQGHTESSEIHFPLSSRAMYCICTFRENWRKRQSIVELWQGQFNFAVQFTAHLSPDAFSLYARKGPIASSGQHATSEPGVRCQEDPLGPVDAEPSEVPLGLCDGLADRCADIRQSVRLASCLLWPARSKCIFPDDDTQHSAHMLSFRNAAGAVASQGK